MKIAVIGDAMLDIETVGSWDGDCPENKAVTKFKGVRPVILPGGAANTAAILANKGVTCDGLFNGPGSRDRLWVSELLKQTLKINRIVWSGVGQICVKVRGIVNNEVAIRIDMDDVSVSGQSSGFDMALLNMDKWDAVVFCDYNKGSFRAETEHIVRELIKKVPITVVDSKRKDYSLWNGATAICPNQDEGASIFGSTDPCVIRNKVGTKCCYVTNGAAGANCSFNGLVELIGIDNQVEHPYVVGAGDAFVAGLVMSLVKGDNFITAGQCGVELAHSYVSRPRKP